MKTFLIVGLGRFGSAAAEKLFDMGHEVMIIDQDEEAVNRMAEHATHASIGDARDMDVLKSIGASECQCAIVAMGEDLSASILITMNLKDLGVPMIICKAQNETYKRALERVGADRVLIPEREMAIRMVQSIGSNSFRDYIDFSGDYAIAEIEAPAKWCGKSLKELNVRAKYEVSVLVIRSADEKQVKMSPGAEDRIEKGDTVTVMGSNAALAKLQKL